MVAFAVVAVVDILVGIGRTGGSRRSTVLECTGASYNLNHCSSQTGLLGTGKEGRIRTRCGTNKRYSRQVTYPVAAHDDDKPNSKVMDR